MSKSSIVASEVVVVFCDLQENIIGLSETNPEKTIRKSALALGKLCKVFGIPAIATMVGGEKPPTLVDEVEEGYGAIEVFIRTGPDCFNNAAIVAKLASTGRKTVIFCGVATELVVGLSTISAVEAGYRAFIAMDATGGRSERGEAAMLQRINAAGGLLTSVFTLTGELAVDFTNETGPAAREILYSL